LQFFYIKRQIALKWCYFYSRLFFTVGLMEEFANYADKNKI